MSVFNRGTNIIIQADPGMSIREAIAAAASAEASAEAAANSAESAATDNFRTLRDVATLLANTSIVYGAGAAQVAAGDIMQTRAEGFSYEVAASAATDQHVTTAGGVKLYVLPRDGVIDFAAFAPAANGASATPTDDYAKLAAALATGNNVFLDDGDYYSTQRIVVDRGHLYGRNANSTRIWSGTPAGEFLIELKTSERGGTVDNIALEAKEDGRRGLLLSGAVGAMAQQVFINNFTDVSLQLGDTTAGNGIYWSKVGCVRIRLDPNKNGETGLLIDGQTIPGSNDASLEDVVIGGNFKRSLHIKGNGNTVKNGTIELTRGDENVVSMIYIEGGGNRVVDMYVEPFGAVAPQTLVEFGPNSSGNEIEIWPQYQPLYNASANIIDLGAHNKVKLKRLGSNFRIGPEAEPSQNLVLNSNFKVWRNANNPAGWLFGTTRISKVAPAASWEPHILRMTEAATSSAIELYFTDYNTAATGQIPFDLEYLRGKPVIAGVWCRTSVVNAGGVKFMQGLGAVSRMGEDSHSGSGNWELLIAHGNVAEASDRVGMELRSHKSNTAITGTVDFRDPFFVIGTDIPFFTAKPMTDRGGRMFGDLDFAADAVAFEDSPFLRIGGFYYWPSTTGVLRFSTTKPTTATRDTHGTAV